MAKKLTQNEWIAKAREVHGDKYDYSKVNYINGRSQVIITCPIHGDFSQIARVHINQKCGCPKCSRNVLLTNEEFIEKARKVHGDKFDYSKVNITSSKEKITIICPVHGEFTQLYNDHLRGCGCNKCRLTKSKEYNPILNKSEMREYRIWKAIKTRVANPNTSDAERYILRGIKCCDRWLESFEAFYADMGDCPEGFSIDRIDPDGDYCPENCRWANATTQSQNRGEFNKIFTYNGESLVLKEWAKRLGIKYTTLYQRIYRSGLSFEEAIQDDPFNRQIEINGESKTLKEWCVKYDIKYQTVINRIHKHNWSYERAITTPGPKPIQSKDIV